jgi:hypothetical protein
MQIADARERREKAWKLRAELEWSTYSADAIILAMSEYRQVDWRLTHARHTGLPRSHFRRREMTKLANARPGEWGQRRTNPVGL